MAVDPSTIDPALQYDAVFIAKIDLTATWPGLYLYPNKHYTVRGDLVIANVSNVQNVTAI